MSKKKTVKSKPEPVPEITPIPETAKVEVIPEDLKNQWGAIQSIEQVFHCLQTGTFTHRFMPMLKASLAFVSTLHEQMVDKALFHPQAFMIPQLKKELDTRKSPPAPTEPL